MRMARVTVTTGNKIDPDKHWLMHIHTTTLYKRSHHSPSTDTESTTHATSHAYTCASYHAHALICIHAHHTSSSSSSLSPSLSLSLSYTCTNADTRPRKHRHAAPVNRNDAVLGDRTHASGKVKSHLHSARRKTTCANIISDKTVAEESRSRILVEPRLPSAVLQGKAQLVRVTHSYKAHLT